MTMGLIVIGMTSPVSAQVYANDEAGIRQEWSQDVRAYHRSVKALDRKVREGMARLEADKAEFEAAKQQQYSVPSMDGYIPTPVPETGLVPRTFYYPDPYYGGCIAFSGLFPPGWGYSG